MKGFTLVEILVSVAILSFVVAGIFMVLNIADKSWHSDMGLLDLQQQARQAMDGMVREIRQSDSSDITITNNGGRVEFYIPDVSNAISYYLENNQIIREHPLSTKKILANDVNSLNFSLLSQVLEIQMEARKTVLQRELSLSLKEKARLRNE